MGGAFAFGLSDRLARPPVCLLGQAVHLRVAQPTTPGRKFFAWLRGAALHGSSGPRECTESRPSSHMRAPSHSSTAVAMGVEHHRTRILTPSPDAGRPSLPIAAARPHPASWSRPTASSARASGTQTRSPPDVCASARSSFCPSLTPAATSETASARFRLRLLPLGPRPPPPTRAPP